MISKAPVRVLHLVGGMDRAGIETWLMHLLRRVDREQVRMDFLVHREDPGDYAQEIRALGSQVIAIPQPRFATPWRYAENLRRALDEHGPYNVVHSHLHHFGGFSLRLVSKRCSSLRIAHSHVDDRFLHSDLSILRRLYQRLMMRWLARYADYQVAASRRAAEALFGMAPEDNPLGKLLFYGIDLTPFEESGNIAEVRRNLNIGSDAFVIGHVGRFAEQKNHQFLLRVFAEVLAREPESYLLLIGEGHLAAEIQQEIALRGLDSHVRLLGTRADIPALMQAMDVFAFPSLYEGLGLVLVEAQAAGTPCVISDVIPEEANVVPSLVCRMPLGGSVEDWAEAIVAFRGHAAAFGRERARRCVSLSHFNIDYSLRHLLDLYSGETKSNH